MNPLPEICQRGFARVLLAILFAFFAAACGGAGGGALGDVKSSHDAGRQTTRVYDVGPDAAYAAAVAVLHEEHADDPIEEHAAEHWAMGKRSPAIIPWRYGAFVGVWVRDAGPNRAQVDVVTRRVGATAAIGVTEETFHAELARRLTAR